MSDECRIHGGFDFGLQCRYSRPVLNTPLLHAYWRMEYIKAPGYPSGMERPFTALPALGDDRTALIVHRAPYSYLLLNRYPYNAGHLLAIPFREVAEPEELPAEERADLMDEIIFGRRLVGTVLKPDGVNIGFNLVSAAGGSISHLHAHIVPRWNGDNNFMPVIADTRTLPLALDAMWEQLAAGAADLDGG